MRIKLIVFLVMIVFAIIGLGCSTSYCGDKLVSLVHCCSDYLVLMTFLLGLGYIIYKLDAILKYVPFWIVLLNTGTLSILSTMYFGYDILSMSTITNSMLAIGFNIASGLSVISFVVDLCILPFILLGKSK